MALDYKNSLNRYRRYLATLQNQPLWNASFWLGLTIVLIILMVVMFLRPTLITIASLMGQNKEQKRLLIQMDEKNKILELADSNYAVVRPKLDILNQVMPNDSKWSELTDRLNGIATESGVILKSLKVENAVLQGKEIESTAVQQNTAKPKSEPLPEGVKKVTFSMVASGDYQQLKTVLGKIEKDGRLMVIDNARINKLKNGSLELTVNGYAAFYAVSTENI